VKFLVTAVDAAQRVVAVLVDGADISAARATAARQGYAVISIKEKRSFRLTAPARAFPLTLFSLELHSLLDAGLNVVEALGTLAKKQAGGPHRQVLERMLQSLRCGESFSQALEAQSDHFSALYVATIRSSEQTGDLKEALARYIAYAEAIDQVRRKVVAALLYPAILLAVGVVVLCFLLFYVVPRFARVYEDIATGLPFFSSALLWIGRTIDQHIFVFVALAVGFGAGVVCLWSQDTFRARSLERIARLPILGDRVQVYRLARFYRTLAMLLRAGIPVIRALEMVSGLLPLDLRLRMQRAHAAIRNGSAISASLTEAGLATAVATQLMIVGERGGQMGALMDRIARFYDEDTSRFVDSFARVLEPALMAAIGIAVGLVVVLMYMPIFELSGAIQ
jgi:general secretion pathway protein F